MIKNKEMWKDIIGYEGLYRISNYGRVMSLNYLGHDRIAILKPKIVGRGYYSVGLCVDYDIKYMYIHRLVGIHFIDNPNNYPQINHIDENKTNNHFSNLEWCTVSYNNTHNDRHKLVNIKNSKPVIQYDKIGNIIRTYNSQKDVEKYGFTQQHVSRCCNGLSKTHKGYIWKFAILENDGFNKGLVYVDD